MADFIRNSLKEIIRIDSIITLHYFEYTKDYAFKGEAHDFWEIVYVDRGNVNAVAGDRLVRLNQGEAIFHKPNEFHSIEAAGDYSNTVVISFASNSAAMSFFESKALRLSKLERELIFKIVSEGRKSFKEPLNIVDLQEMTKNETLEFGSLQLIKIYLEELLISLVRSNNSLNSKEKSPTGSKTKNLEDIFALIEDYLEKNIDKNVTLDSVCNYFFFSKTYIKTLFKNKTGMGLVAYFNKMKLNKAKQLISQNEYTFTEISEMLSYSSVHYFSRCFKAYTGMSPTEYSQSIKSTGIL